MPEPVRYHDRALVVGKTRSGKSVLARYLVGQMTGARRLLVNVKGLEQVGVAPVRSLEAIDWSAPVVDFIPPSMHDQVFADLYRAAFERGGPRVIWLDEAMGVTRANYAPEHLRLVQQQGAALGIGHVYCSQRPQNIATELKSEAEHIFICGTVFARRDLDALAVEMGLSGDELSRRLRELHGDHGDFAFLWYERGSGELTDCAPLPEAWVGDQGGLPGAAPSQT